MKETLLIIGASGHGKVVADVAIKMNRWKKVAFLDDNENIKSSIGIEVIGKTNECFNYIDTSDIVVAIGSNIVREQFIEQLIAAGASIPILIHPNAIIGTQVAFGVGTVIMAGAIINSSAKVGQGCIINTGATIDHDCIIDDYVHISPGVHLAGTVTIGKNSWLGIGCIVSNNICITRDCVVGAGAVVIKDISDKGIYVGVPARRL